jgi:hypothetical protein
MVILPIEIYCNLHVSWYCSDIVTVESSSGYLASQFSGFASVCRLVVSINKGHMFWLRSVFVEYLVGIGW